MERRELEQLFAFDRWANRQTLDALRSVQPEPEELVRLLAHVLSATDNWLSSVEGVEPLTRPDVQDVEALASYLDQVDARTISFRQDLADERLGQRFELRDPSRARFETVTGDVLQHVVLHGVEHRAQIMYEVGKLHGQPSELQYALFVSERPDRP